MTKTEYILDFYESAIVAEIKQEVSQKLNKLNLNRRQLKQI